MKRVSRAGMQGMKAVGLLVVTLQAGMIVAAEPRRGVVAEVVRLEAVKLGVVEEEGVGWVFGVPDAQRVLWRGEVEMDEEGWASPRRALPWKWDAERLEGRAYLRWEEGEEAGRWAWIDAVEEGGTRIRLADGKRTTGPFRAAICLAHTVDSLLQPSGVRILGDGERQVPALIVLSGAGEPEIAVRWDTDQRAWTDPTGEADLGDLPLAPGRVVLVAAGKRRALLAWQARATDVPSLPRLGPGDNWVAVPEVTAGRLLADLPEVASRDLGAPRTLERRTPGDTSRENVSIEEIRPAGRLSAVRMVLPEDFKPAFLAPAPQDGEGRP